nr:DUF948 domain-containing protein [Oculatella sp. LEGE 06141]
MVAVSLTAVLVAALPALRELARAARSAEKLFDTLSRELPPTLESIRLTGMEITELTDEVNDGVQSAGRVVQQVDQSLSGVRQQARQANTTTRSVFAGIRAAWKTFNHAPPARRSLDRLPPGSSEPVQLEDDYAIRDAAYAHRDDDGDDDNNYDAYSEPNDTGRSLNSEPPDARLDELPYQPLGVERPIEGSPKLPQNPLRPEQE